jgi:hypothetical protein
MLRQKNVVDTSDGPNEPSNPELDHDQCRRSPSVERSEGIQTFKMMDKVAELEFALAAAKQEQNALREQLKTLKHHSQTAENTTPSPRHTSPLGHSTGRGYELVTTPPRRSPNRVQEDVFQQNYQLRGKVAELHDHLAKQDVLFRQELEQRIQSRNVEWTELTARLHHTEKESQERLQQLLDLKHSISALTRMESQVTDSELVERVDRLYHRIREFVISSFRRTKMHFGDVAGDTAKTFERIHPRYATVSSSNRLPFYQSVVANALMQVFEETICIGLPSSGPLTAIRQLAAFIHDTGSEYREWRRATIRALEKSEAKHALQEEKESLLHRLVGDIEHQLFSLTSSNLPANARAALLDILHRAADLQQTLLLQKAQYKLRFFRHNGAHEAEFDGKWMESINDFDDEMGEDDDTGVKRGSWFCVFPCLEKFGDEFGEKAEVSNVLLRAKVCSGVG